MARIVETSRSRRQLKAIWRTIAKDNRPAADRMLRKIARSVENAATFPDSGSPRDDLRPGLRVLVIHPYLVLYNHKDDAITVVAVLHGARDIENLV